MSETAESASPGCVELERLEKEASRCGLVELELHEDGPYGSSARLLVRRLIPGRPGTYRYRVIWLDDGCEQSRSLDRVGASLLVKVDAAARAAARAACARGFDGLSPDGSGS